LPERDRRGHEAFEIDPARAVVGDGHANRKAVAYKGMRRNRDAAHVQLFDNTAVESVELIGALSLGDVTITDDIRGYRSE
jgi:hypothetical protein